MLTIGSLIGYLVVLYPLYAWLTDGPTVQKLLITQLVVGDSPSEQIIHEALRTYLEQREARTAAHRPKLRSEAVAAVVKALRAVD